MIRFLPLMLLGLISVFYLFFAGVVARKRDVREHTIRLLLLFLLISAAGEFLHALWQLLNFFVPLQGVLSLLPMQIALLLAFIYFHLSRTFLRYQETDRDWWRPGIVVMAGVLLLQGVLLLILPADMRFGQWGVQYRQVGLGILAGGWMIFTGGVALLTLRAYRGAQGAWHRNRVKYWLLALFLIVFADTLLFAGRGMIGSGLRFAATLLMVYAIVSYRLLDVSQMVRYTLSYLIITFLTIIIYLLGFASMQYFFQEILVLDYGPLAPTVVAALMLAILFNPLLKLVQRLIDRVVWGRRYDPNLLVSEYSASISNILSLKRLAVVILRLTRRAMDSRHGTLFLITSPQDGQEQARFHLQAVKRHGQKSETFVPQGDLAVDGPVAGFLSQKHRPLTQYDLDMLPHFEQTPEAEREWLDCLDAEVYVPIHAKDQWIALLVLGPKNSRRPYFDGDLTLLKTLADQTAVALQNARLVQDLFKLNKDLKQAYHDLDRANRQMKELDQLKSAFIGVVTHELRSPMSNIDFSMQLIERHGMDHLIPEQREQLEQLKVNIETTKHMIDNLVNFATFLSKRGDLFITNVNIPTIVEAALFINKPAAVKKQINLQVDIPPDMPPVPGDAGRLTDAVHQLIDNAIKFTPPGGQVWVRCRMLPETLRFEVQDTGAGISPAELPTLWQEFVQMADPLLRGVEGLGLGLTLVQYVAHAHNGEVFAESEAGVGSTFGFTIPLNGAEQDAG